MSNAIAKVEESNYLVLSKDPEEIKQILAAAAPEGLRLSDFDRVKVPRDNARWEIPGQDDAPKEFQAVILSWSKVRTWWGGVAYEDRQNQDDATGRPVCTGRLIDGVWTGFSDRWINKIGIGEIGSQPCLDCPIYKQGMGGKGGCTTAMNLALCLPNHGLMPVFLKLPSMSVLNADKYIKGLALRDNVRPEAVVTAFALEKVQNKNKVDVMVVTMKLVRKLTDTEAVAMAKFAAAIKGMMSRQPATQVGEPESPAITSPDLDAEDPLP